MEKESYQKRQIKKCLNCKKGVSVICEYKDFYEMLVNVDSIKAELKNPDSNSVPRIKKKLHLSSLPHP